MRAPQAALMTSPPALLRNDLVTGAIPRGLPLGADVTSIAHFG